MAAPIRLAMRTWGEGPRRVLLLHGLSSSAAGWWRVGPDLAALGCHVVAPDLRGHGVTGQSDTLDASMAPYVADVLALGGGWSVVLGHSLGGRVALECQLAGDRFADVLVLEDPALHIPNDPGLVADLSSEYETELTPAAFHERYPRWAVEDVVGKVDALRQSNPEVVQLTMEALMDGDHWSDVTRVRVPTLVIGAHPDEGGFVPPAVGEAAAKQPNVEYENIDGAGHSIHRDSYDAFWSVLASFLMRHGYGSG